MTAGRKPPGAGRSSYELIDRERFFEELPLETSTVLLDLGCGRGEYAIPIAELIGPGGKVYGVDAWEEGLAELRERASSLGLTNVETLAADVNQGIPLGDRMVDVVLIATVLHDLLRDSTGEVVLREAARVLKPEGKLVIVEYKKIETPSGPPLSIRLSEQELQEILRPFGFRMNRVYEVGPYHYLLIASMQE